MTNHSKTDLNIDWGIILFAHGSRDPLWCKPIETIASAIAGQSPRNVVRCAYLELMKPDLETVVADMMTAHGVAHIKIAPMFLGVGVHARQDLPLLVEALRLAHPSLHLELMPSIGENPQVIAAIAAALTQT
jgi:sirohydrochlorin cobaltochelatase